MKNYVVLIICISFFYVAKCQDKKDSLMKVMAIEACDVFKSKDMAGKKKEDIELELGLAILPVYSNHADAIKDVFGMDVSESDRMEKLGEMLGGKLAMVCPEFIRIFASSSSSENKDGNNLKTATFSFTGVLVKVVSGEFTYFLVKDKSGKTEKIWWMEYFKGSDILSDPKNLNSNIKLSYQEKEVYNNAVKDYIKIKVATGLEK